MSDHQQMDAMEAFAELGRMDYATMDLNAVLTRVSELAKATIPGADEVSVTLVRDGYPTTAAFTGDLALQLDEKQYESGYGPCLDAAQAGGVLVIDDMATENRWPKYTPRAVEHGAQSSCSVGLPVQRVGGALNFYAKTSNAFDPDSVMLAKTFAGYAAVALSNAQLYASTAELAQQMQAAMESRALIEQAKGVIAAQQGCTTEQAFNIMSQHSQNNNRKLRDIAAQIVHHATTQ